MGAHSQVLSYSVILQVRKMEEGGAPKGVTETASGMLITDLSFAQLRDDLLALAPLDREYVKAINTAEADFWRRNQGYRVDFSDKI